MDFKLYKYLVVLVISLLFSKTLYPQNIILNGDVEKIKRKNKWFFISNVKQWYNPTIASPDYQTNTLNWNTIKSIKAKSGDVYLGLSLVGRKNYTEYVTSKLNEELITDSLYCLTFYVALLKDNFGNKKSIIHLPQLDAYFSNKRIKKITSKPLYPKYTASISNIGNSQISNIGFWEKRSAVYKAKGNEKYLTFGIFSNSHSYKKVFIVNGEEYVYLALDNFSLIPISDSSQCSCNKIRKDFAEIITPKDTANKNSLLKLGLVVRFNKLHFATNSSELDTTSIQELQELTKLLKNDTSLCIRINGHTDSKGYEKRNISLSEQRAKAVVDYLVLQGIDKDRLSYKGYGSSYPLETNMTEEGRARNRRVEFEIIQPENDK